MDYPTDPEFMAFSRLVERVVDELCQGIRSGASLPAALRLEEGKHPAYRHLAGHYIHPRWGATLAAALTFHTPKPASWAGYSSLRQLASGGVDTNVPDAQGRVASIQGMTNGARNVDARDLPWAVRYGANPLAVERTAQGARSWLSLDFGNPLKPRGDDFWNAVRFTVDVAARNLALRDPDAARRAVAGMGDAPVLPVHGPWWAQYRAGWLEDALPAESLPTPRAAPRL